jgi:hypothetical protein
MKKIIARTILGMLFISFLSFLLWRLILQPCMELGLEYGMFGIGVYLLTLAVVLFFIYCWIKLIDWCIDNA